MATNTCISAITYSSIEDAKSEPFFSMRHAQAETMTNEGKSEFYPNYPTDPSDPLCMRRDMPTGSRYWVDHAAAQEFIDWALINAPIHGVTITDSKIVDMT